MADGLWKAISKALRGDDEDEEKGEKTDAMKARESHSAALEDSGYDEGVRGVLRVGAGMCGWFVSLSLLTANWIFDGACVLTFAGLLWRIPKEEQMMIEAFGDEYRKYMDRTGRFFPKF